MRLLPTRPDLLGGRRGQIRLPSHASDDLEDTLELTDVEIREDLSGNRCRCAAYPTIFDGIKGRLTNSFKYHRASSVQDAVADRADAILLAAHTIIRSRYPALQRDGLTRCR